MSKQERLQQAIIRCRKHKELERWKAARATIIKEIAESAGACCGATLGFIKCACGRFKEGLSRQELIEIAGII